MQTSRPLTQPRALMHARYGIVLCCSGVMRPGTLPVAASLAGAFVAGTASVLVGDMRCSFSATTIETVAKVVIATT